MLLHLISITFVVCTAEISEFHAFFLCLSHLLENFSLVSFGACDNFSLPFVVVSLSMPQTRGTCGHLKGSYDNHSSCLNCSGCFRFNCCSVCQAWSDSTWSLVGRRRRFCDRSMGKTGKEAKVKKPKDSASRNSSSSRQGLEQTVAWVDPPGSTADRHDDDAASGLSRSSSGVSGHAGTPRFPAVKAHREHRALVQPDGGSIVPPPARSQAGDLAGKYGVQAPAKDFEATLLGPNPPPVDSDQVMLSTDRSPRSESNYLVERLPSCETGQNTRLAMKESVQQSSSFCSWTRFKLNDRCQYRDPVSGIQDSVPPITPGKPGTKTTPGAPGLPVTLGDSVTPGDSVRPVFTGQKAQKEKTDQCLDQS